MTAPQLGACEGADGEAAGLGGSALLSGRPTGRSTGHGLGGGVPHTGHLQRQMLPREEVHEALFWAKCDPGIPGRGATPGEETSDSHQGCRASTPQPTAHSGTFSRDPSGQQEPSSQGCWGGWDGGHPPPLKAAVPETDSLVTQQPRPCAGTQGRTPLGLLPSRAPLGSGGCEAQLCSASCPALLCPPHRLSSQAL